MATDERRFEVLLRPECMALLATRPIGRLAVAEDDEPPFVVPVNYVLDGETIVFRSDPGEKLRLLRHHPASFQVDEFDELLREGWTVLVRGTTEKATPDQIERLKLHTWAPGEKATWIQMHPRLVSGRRIRMLRPWPDDRAYR